MWNKYHIYCLPFNKLMQILAFCLSFYQKIVCSWADDFSYFGVFLDRPHPILISERNEGYFDGSRFFVPQHGAVSPFKNLTIVQVRHHHFRIKCMSLIDREKEIFRHIPSKIVYKLPKKAKPH